MTFTIYFKRNSYNQHRSYFANTNRYIGSTLVKSADELDNKVAELKSNGFAIDAIYNSIGKRIG